MKRITKKYMKKYINNLGYKLIKEYVGNNNRRKVIISDEFGYRYDVGFFNLKNHIPDIVSISNPYSLKNISLWIKLNNLEYKLCKDNQYQGNNKELKFYHKKCGNYFYTTWTSVLRKNYCNICTNKRIGKNNNLAFLHPNLVKEWSNKNKTNPANVTIYSHKMAIWNCLVCKHEYVTMIRSRTQMKSGCPKCASSGGEKIIRKFLLDNNIKNFPEHRFDDCKYKNRLFFDFYLPDYNICIEYNGIQHYESVKFFGGKKTFEENKKRDKIKKKYCKNKNIKLFIIPYWDFDNIIPLLLHEIKCR